MFLSVQSVSKPHVTVAIANLSSIANGFPSNDHASNAQFSADERYVIFNSSASNLVEGDTNNATDIFRRDLVTGAIERLSGLGSGQANGSSHSADFSADGRYMLFTSTATNFGFSDRNFSDDVFRKDLVTGAVERLSIAYGVEADGHSSLAQFSADEKYVFFESFATNLVPLDTNNSGDIFRRNLATGEIERISTTARGGQADGSSFNARLSADGKYLIFESSARNLIADDPRFTDVFRKNLDTGAVERLSGPLNGQQPDGNSGNAQISADGRYVVFESDANNLVTGDTGFTDIFRKNLLTGAIERVSTAADGQQADDHSRNAKISADGRYVFFESKATNLTPGTASGVSDLFRKDLTTGTVERLTFGAGGMHGFDYPLDAEISADGRQVIFQRQVLPSPDDTGILQIFRYDLFYLAHSTAIDEGRFLEVKLGTGSASSAKVDWGDGTSSSVTPSAGTAAFHHAYASAGIKAASVTLVEGAQTWEVPHTVNVAAGSMARNTTLMDTLSGGGGTDSLTGDAFANILIGNGGNDTIKADAGNDRLVGGLGKDTFTGGKGKDVFVFDDKETGSSKSKADYILDFKGKEGDRIDLKLVDADTRKKGDQKFVFIGKEAFTKAGQVRYEKTKKETFVYLNTDSDNAAEAVIKLKGSIDLSKGWFVL